jgi:hypothetical protein
VRVLLWHVHGSWTTAFVQGRHEYLVPVTPGRGPDGRGRAHTWKWPDSVREVSPAALGEEHIDVVILQRPEELFHLAPDWLGRIPGIDLPAIYLEHNAPQGRIAEMVHPAEARPKLMLVHVTHFNDLFWDCHGIPTRVIEHGIPDPGYRYSGELARIAVAINEPVRRMRVTGTDLLPRFEKAAPVDVFGIGAGEIGGHEDPSQSTLHFEIARRRLYLHPFRWTSLGLALIEAMHLGMPVVALATTEAVEAVPPEGGVISTNVEKLVQAVRDLIRDEELARSYGKAAREAALERYNLVRFLADWDQLLLEMAR